MDNRLMISKVKYESGYKRVVKRALWYLYSLVSWLWGYLHEVNVIKSAYNYTHRHTQMSTCITDQIQIRSVDYTNVYLVLMMYYSYAKY